MIITRSNYRRTHFWLWQHPLVYHALLSLQICQGDISELCDYQLHPQPGLGLNKEMSCGRNLSCT
jgi:hypothetical protein